MKYIFSGGFILLMALSLVAWRLDCAHRGEPGGRTVITWASDDNPARREQIDLFNKLHPEIVLRLDPIVISQEKVIVQCMAGVGPDLIDAPNGFCLEAYVKAGIAWDITDEIKARGIDVQREVWPALLVDMVYEGRVYAVGANAAVSGIWYNKKVFQQCGISYPKDSTSWEELIRLGQGLTLRGDDGRVKRFGLAFDWMLDWSVFLAIHGARIYSDDGARCEIDSPQAIQAIQFMHDLVYKYGISPTPTQEASLVLEGGWGGGQIAQLAAGRTAMAVGGRFWLCSLRRYENLDLGVVAIPGITESRLRGYGRGTVINSRSPRRKEAFQFLLFQLGREYNELINHQADGVGPVMRFTRTGLFLHDPAFPNETYNVIWRDEMEKALPEEASIYANGYVVQRIIWRQLDLVRNNQKTPAEAMRTAARLINEHIAGNLREDPSLREKWELAHGEKP